MWISQWRQLRAGNQLVGQIITNRIIGADPQQPVVNQLVAILKNMPHPADRK